MRVLLALSFPVLLLGCPSDDKVDDTGETGDTADTSDTADTGETADTSDTSDTSAADLAVTFQLVDFLYQTPIVGATMLLDGGTTTSDASGVVSGSASAGAVHMAAVTAADYPPVNVYLSSEGLFFSPIGWGILAVSNNGLSAMEILLDVDVDPTKGVLLVTTDAVATDGTTSHFGGVTLDVDSGYDVALALDEGQASGFTPGNVTIANSKVPATIIFVNVPAGAAVITATTPDGSSCFTAPSFDSAAASYDVQAGALTYVFLACHE